MTSGVLLQLPASRKKLRYASSLRVAAATLKHALPGEITSTKVVGSIASDEDAARLRQVVSQIAAEFSLDTELALNGCSFSVRFTLRD